MGEYCEFYMEDQLKVIVRSTGRFTSCLYFKHEGVSVDVPDEYELIDEKCNIVESMAGCYVMSKLQDYELLQNGATVLRMTSKSGHIIEQVFARHEHH